MIGYILVYRVLYKGLYRNNGKENASPNAEKGGEVRIQILKPWTLSQKARQARSLEENLKGRGLQCCKGGSFEEGPHEKSAKRP